MMVGGLGTIVPKLKPKSKPLLRPQDAVAKPVPPSFEAQIRAVVQNTLKMKEEGFTDKEIMASFDRGMGAGKKKAEEVKRV